MGFCRVLKQFHVLLKISGVVEKNSLKKSVNNSCMYEISMGPTFSPPFNTLFSVVLNAGSLPCEIS